MGVLTFGAVAAHAFWWWNAQINVEGTDIHTTWKVAGPEGTALLAEDNKFKPQIYATLPEGTAAVVESQAKTERVHLRVSNALQCQPNGVPAVVEYRVAHKGQTEGKTVIAKVTLNDGIVLDQAQGELNQRINLKVLIPVTNPDCG